MSILIDTETLSALSSGPRLLFMAAVHGDEPCGTVGSDLLKKDIAERLIVLKKGGVEFIRRANVRACEQGVRHVDVNLNRYFETHAAPTLHEHFVANELCPRVYDSDFAFAIHSITNKGNAFTIGTSMNEAVLKAVRAIQPEVHLHMDCQNAWKAKGRPHATSDSYAMSVGVPSLTIECGQHNSPDAIAIAKQSMINVMALYGIVDPSHSAPLSDKPTQYYRVTKIAFNDEISHYEGHKKPAHFQHYKKGAVIAHYNNGSVFTASSDSSHIIFANDKHDDTPGSEMFYEAVEFDAPA